MALAMSILEREVSWKIRVMHQSENPDGMLQEGLKRKKTNKRGIVQQCVSRSLQATLL